MGVTARFSPPQLPTSPDKDMGGLPPKQLILASEKESWERDWKMYEASPAVTR
jgi:hypothetical protein